MRDFADTHSPHLSKFFPTRKKMAVHGNPFGSRSCVKSAATSAAPAARSFRDDLIAGLSRHPRQLSCKFFYDEVGAQLFRRICDLPEYYITRTELGILRLHGA